MEVKTQTWHLCMQDDRMYRCVLAQALPVAPRGAAARVHAAAVSAARPPASAAALPRHPGCSRISSLWSLRRPGQARVAPGLGAQRRCGRHSQARRPRLQRCLSACLPGPSGHRAPRSRRRCHLPRGRPHARAALPGSLRAPACAWPAWLPFQPCQCCTCRPHALRHAGTWQRMRQLVAKSMMYSVRAVNEAVQLNKAARWSVAKNTKH